MSTRDIIDYAANDNAVEFRNAMYAAIHDRVTAAIESKKQEIAQNLITQSESVESLDELNRDTLHSYTKKANKSMDDIADAYSAGKNVKDSVGPKRKGIIDNRVSGLERAEKKLSKEEVELQTEEHTKITNPKVHDLTHLSHADAYDHTQYNDKIKDGDVLKVKGGTAAMIGPYPAMVHGTSTSLHKFGDGHSVHTIDGGKYEKTGKLANSVHHNSKPDGLK